MAKIFSVELSDGKNNFMELDLPATDYQLLDMQDRLHLAPGELPEWEIYQHHGFEYLEVFLANECNLYELNALAQKLGEMERWQISAFEGLFRMALDRREGPMSMDDIMTYANSTECCHVVSEATNDAKLGRFYADNGFVAELTDLPDSIYEKLDFARIGKEMREAEKGVYTKYGYVLQNDNLKAVTEKYSVLPKTPNYTVQLLMARYPFDTDGQPEIVEALNLPATDDQLIHALEQVGAASWDEVVFEVEDSAVPRFFEKVEYIDGIHPVNELAQAIKQIEELGELTRYKAVLESLDCDDLKRAMDVAEHLDEYLLEPDTLMPEDVARNEIAFSVCNTEAELLLPHVNLTEYGRSLLKHYKSELTPYGLVARRDGAPLQQMETQEQNAGMGMGGMVQIS